MIKVLCFDLDNTLIDRQYSAYRAYDAIIRHDSKNLLSEEEYVTYVNELLAHDQFGLISHRVNNEWYMSRFDFANQRTDEEWFQFWLSYSLQQVHLYPGTLATLHYLKSKYQLGIITNGPSAPQRGKLSKFPDLSIFGHILVSGEWGTHKPDRSIFEEMLRLFDVSPAEMIYVGDNQDADIQGALNAGIRPVWLNGHHHVGRHHVTEITSIEELIKLEQGGLL